MASKQQEPTNSALSDARSALQSEIEQAALQLLRPRMRQLGITAEQIEIQDEAGLEGSLEAVDRLIENPSELVPISAKRDSNGFLKAEHTAYKDVGLSEGEVKYPVNLNSILIPIRRKILDRLLSIRSQKGTYERDSTTGDELSRSLDLLDYESGRVAQLGIQNAELQARITAYDRESRQKVIESNRASWQKFFARENMATYVGAGLIIFLTIVHVIVMFKPPESRPNSEIVNNAFLLILGYFFGQSSSGSQGRLGDGDSRSTS